MQLEPNRMHLMVAPVAVNSRPGHSDGRRLVMLWERNEDMSDLQRIDHVALVVDDIDTAVRWYCERFSCDVTWHDTT